mmetsp:Transcript_41342/g.93185  ORF Transcript_41342/g.93185 Transcript_41342/m.93185 type:complete len:201 (+) Transcript_41342:52-654(+)
MVPDSVVVVFRRGQLVGAGGACRAARPGEAHEGRCRALPGDRCRRHYALFTEPGGASVVHGRRTGHICSSTWCQGSHPRAHHLVGPHRGQQRIDFRCAGHDRNGGMVRPRSAALHAQVAAPSVDADLAGRSLLSARAGGENCRKDGGLLGASRIQAGQCGLRNGNRAGLFGRRAYHVGSLPSCPGDRLGPQARQGKVLSM